MIELGSAFTLVKPSELSLKDKFMHFSPELKNERLVMGWIIEAIKSGLPDFYCQTYDPSFNDDFSGIQYLQGQRPAMGKDYDWWTEAARKYLPSHNSRLGKWLEYAAFSALLIKSLVEQKGYAVSTAWYIVCNNSRTIGRYRNSLNSRSNFEATGSKEICGFRDLGNTFKMLDNEGAKDGIILASGAANTLGDDYPVAMINKFDKNTGRYLGYVGWIVIPADASIEAD